jgi:hypothetical protein
VEQRKDTTGSALKVAQYVGPFVLGIIGAWGTIQYKDGSREQRVLILEAQVKELKEQTISKREMTLSMESIRDGIAGIRQDIRDLRNGKVKP